MGFLGCVRWLVMKERIVGKNWGFGGKIECKGGKFV